MDEEKRMLKNLLRVGKVNSVDGTTFRARVYYDDLKMVSDWLPVLQHSGAGVYISSGETHSHSGHTTSWMPEIGQEVLCVYLPVKNADGFILGVIA